MTAHGDDATDQPLLTMRQAYDVAFRFIAQCYERNGSRDESLFWVLLFYMAVTREEPAVWTTDPAAWHDWQRCVQETLDGAPEPKITAPTAECRSAALAVSHRASSGRALRSEVLRVAGLDKWGHDEHERVVALLIGR